MLFITTPVETLDVISVIPNLKLDYWKMVVWWITTNSIPQVAFLLTCHPDEGRNGISCASILNSTLVSPIMRQKSDFSRYFWEELSRSEISAATKKIIQRGNFCKILYIPTATKRITLRRMRLYQNLVRFFPIDLCRSLQWISGNERANEAADEVHGLSMVHNNFVTHQDILIQIKSYLRAIYQQNWSLY